MNRDQIRDIFLRNGFTIKDGQTDLKPYVYAAAEELLELTTPQTTPDVNALAEALVEALGRCRHQASYSIGSVEALQNQLNKIRDTANETITAYRNEVGYEMVANRKLHNANMHRDSDSRIV